MSWEVLTMRSATSFFNPALARSDLRRYWPALFLYVGLWIIFLPVQLWLMAHQGYVPAPDLGEICSDRYIAAVIMALIFGGMMAMASFSYLMNPRSVGAMHALPQRRGTLFWTHFLTGWGMLAAGNLLVALLTAGIALLTGVKLTAALLTWLVVVTLLDLFFMALGTFCAMITGWLLAVPVLYGVANTLALIVTWLGQQLADGLLLGYAPPDALPRLTVWLTPVYRLIQELGQVRGLLYGISYQANADYPSGLAPNGWRAVLLYTAAALVLLALSRLLYARRKSELSGDPAAFPWVRPVFRLGVGLIGGLALGLALYGLVLAGLSFSVPRLCVCIALMGALCYLGASMLVGKTLRVLPKRLTGAAVTALVLVLLCVVLRADVFGYRTRVPQAEKVSSVQVIYLDSTFTLTEPESIQTMVVAQTTLARNDIVGRKIDMGDQTIRVTYTLKNGSSMARRFVVNISGEVQAALSRVVGLEEVQSNVLFNKRNVPESWKPRGGTLWVNALGEERELTAEEAQTLYDAAWRDIHAGNVLLAKGLDVNWTMLEISFQGDRDAYSISSPRTSCTELMQALRDLGLSDSDMTGSMD